MTADSPALPCPHPEKRRYATEEAAHLDEDRASLIRGWFRRPYQCGCGWWHLTSKEPKLVQVPTGADGHQFTVDDLVQWLTHMPQDHHQHIIAKDAAYEVPEPIARAIRDPRSTVRWLHTLKALRTETEHALNQAPAGFSGRRQRRELQARLQMLAARREEARALMPPPPAPPAATTGPATPGTISQYAASALYRRRKAEAHAQADTWLREAHQAEWEQLYDRARLAQKLPPADDTPEQPVGSSEEGEQAA